MISGNHLRTDCQLKQILGVSISFMVQHQLLCSRRTVEIKTYCPLDGVTGGAACTHDLEIVFGCHLLFSQSLVANNISIQLIRYLLEAIVQFYLYISQSVQLSIQLAAPVSME